MVKKECITRTAMNRKIAIMQPTYLPWLGYMRMIKEVDVFIFLDDVQFSKRSWQQRNRIATNMGELWLTVPVLSKGLNDQKINKVTIDVNSNFIKKHLQTLKESYSKSKYSSQVILELEALELESENYLADLNIKLIRWMASYLSITTKTLRSSELKCTGSSAEYLANICEKLGFNEYVSAPGSKEYIDKTDVFLKKNINVTYFSYKHPQYFQHRDSFTPQLSCIDLILNEGPESKLII